MEPRVPAKLRIAIGERGCADSTLAEYAVEKATTSKTRPMPQRIQPSAFLGRRETTTAPIVGYTNKGIPTNTAKFDRASSAGFRSRAAPLARRTPRTPPTATRPTKQRCGGSSHRFLDSVVLPLVSQHHSTALPSPKRYDKRYGVKV
jgi:hypothetical protein